MIPWFARFKNRFGKLENLSKKGLEKVMQTTQKNHQNSDQKWSQNPSKNHSKIDTKKKMENKRFYEKNMSKIMKNGSESRALTEFYPG